MAGYRTGRPRDPRLDAAVARWWADPNLTQSQLARELGVTPKAVANAIMVRDPRRGPAHNARRRRMAQRRKVPCSAGCGKLVWPTYNARGRKGRCATCMGTERATSVRPTTLRCGKCKQWKPDEEFVHQHQRHARRGRHSVCRACQTAAKAAWRAKHSTPCTSCGGLTCPDGRGKGSRDTGLCKACYLATRRLAA